MEIIMVIYTTILFVLLTPSILVKLPKKGNKYTVAFIHGLIFAIIYRITHKMVHNIGDKENFQLYSDSSCNNVKHSDDFEKKNNSIPTGNKDLYFWDASSNFCSRLRKFGTNPNAKK